MQINYVRPPTLGFCAPKDWIRPIEQFRLRFERPTSQESEKRYVISPPFRQRLHLAALVPEAEDPFRAEDRLPGCRQFDRQHNDAGQQRYREGPV